MKRAPVKSSAIAPQNVKQDPLLHNLSQLLHDVSTLTTKIATQVGEVTHASDPNSYILNKECTSFLAEFKRLASIAYELKEPLEQRIIALKQKGPISFPEPIPATSLQTIVILHLVSEQSMAKRHEELSEIRRRQKDLLSHLEVGLKSVHESFDDMSVRLNLLAYMRDCLEKDGVLPANIMYNSHLPQTVSSPFGASQFLNKLKPELSSQSAPVEEMQKEMHVPRDPEQMKKELEKRRTLLLQLRDESRQKKQEPSV